MRNDNAICFTGANGALRKVEYRATAATATNLWTGSQDAIYASAVAHHASDYAGFTDAEFTSVANGGTMTYKLYQPKWQYNDYYSMNFRVNKGDSVQSHYSFTTNTVATTGVSMMVSDGAATLAASVMALGSLMLAF